MNRHTKTLFTVTLIVGVFAGLTVALVQRGSPSGPPIRSNAVYGGMSLEKMIVSAHTIFEGTVAHISATRWNQDSGEQWHDAATGAALQYHTIELEVQRPIVDTIGLGTEATITVLGPSPLDGEASHDLQVGDQAVIFALHTELAWRDGTRPILRLVNAPWFSYFVRGTGGSYYGWEFRKPAKQAYSFEELVREIAQRRETLVQP